MLAFLRLGVMAMAVSAASTAPHPAVAVFQGGRTRIELPGWNGQSPLALSWSGDVALQLPNGVPNTGGAEHEVLVESGSEALRTLRDSGLWVHGSPPDSLRDGGRYQIGVRLGSQGPDAKREVWKGLTRRWPLVMTVESHEDAEDDVLLAIATEHGVGWEDKLVPPGGKGLVQVRMSMSKFREDRLGLSIRKGRQVVARLGIPEAMRMRVPNQASEEVEVDTTSRMDVEPQALPDPSPQEDSPKSTNWPRWSDSVRWQHDIRLVSDSADLAGGQASGDSIHFDVVKGLPKYWSLMEDPSAPRRHLWERAEVAWSGRFQVVARRRVPGGAAMVLVDTTLQVDSARADDPLWRGCLGGLRAASIPDADTGWVVSVRVIGADTVSQPHEISFTTGGRSGLELDPFSDGGVVWTPIRAFWTPDSQVRADWVAVGLPLYSQSLLSNFPVRLLLHAASVPVRRQGGRLVPLGIPRGGWFSAQACPRESDGLMNCWEVDTIWARQGQFVVAFPAAAIEVGEGGIRVGAGTIENGDWHERRTSGEQRDSSPWLSRPTPLVSGPFHVAAAGIPERLRSDVNFQLEPVNDFCPSVPAQLSGRLTTERIDSHDSAHYRFLISGASEGSGPRVRFLLDPLIGSLTGWDHRILTGTLPFPVEFRQSTCRVCDLQADRLESTNLQTNGLPWKVRLDSAMLWNIDRGWDAQVGETWQFRVHEASVDYDVVNLDRFDIRIPGLFDSSATGWILGFSSWQIASASPWRPPQTKLNIPRCTTSAPIREALANGWRLEGRGVELLPEWTTSEAQRRSGTPGAVRGVGVLAPAIVAIPGSSFLDLGVRANPPQEVRLQLDTFAMDFDRQLAFRATTSRRDTIGKLVASGTWGLANGLGLGIPDLRLELRPGWIQGAGTALRFLAPLVEWGSHLEMLTLHARLPLNPQSRIPVGQGTLGGTALVLELGAVPVLRVEAPKWRSHAGNCPSEITLQEAVLDLDGRPILLSGLPEACGVAP